MRRREGPVAKRFVSCRKRRLDTGTRDSDEADDFHRDALRKVEEAVVKTIHTCSSLSLKGIMGAGRRSGEALLHSFSQDRVHIVWEAQSLWSSESRDFGALESWWKALFPDGPRRVPGFDS